MDMAFVRGGWVGDITRFRLGGRRICGRHVVFGGRNFCDGVKMGLFDVIKRGIGVGDGDRVDIDIDKGERFVEEYGKLVELVNAFEDAVEKMSDEDIRDVIRKVRESGGVEGIVEGGEMELYAIVREAGWRAWGLRAYDVQMIGVMCLREGKLAEMGTGEGKTLVAAIAAVIEFLVGDRDGGCLVVTVNDYLAERDAAFARRLGTVLGLGNIGVVLGGMKGEDRRKAYACDVCYVTNSELGFDYLRDNLALNREDIVISKPFGFCIVDEADSILIDEARTPLIITEKIDAPVPLYTNAAKIAEYLQPNVHYTVKRKQQQVMLTDKGYEDCEQMLKIDDLFDPLNPWALKITNAIKAKELFEKNKEYIVRDNAIQIVDEFTGRVMEGRRWSDGLHQAIEAKEEISIMNETITTASISYQAFFQLFPKLAGMTGTAATEANELAESYGLQTVVIPTALPIARRDYPDAIYISKDGKLKELLREIELIHEKGRPILIGTTSVADSEILSGILTEAELPHRILNARPEFVAQESEIIAQAGCKNAITIATNMAGRGTDILLGGNADFITRQIARAALLKPNNDAVKSLEIPGELDLPISDEANAELAVVAEEVSKVCRSCGLPIDDSKVADKFVSSAAESLPFEEIQVMPISEESKGKLQKTLTRLGTVMDQIKEETVSPAVKEARDEVISMGGLYVFGTERHESRRIDDQLRGRCGRQGDPGTTRFFLSLEDNLFATFARERMEKLLTSFRVQSDMDIANPLVQKALDNARVKVEEYFREIRDQLYQYDSIMSSQREAVYRGRRKALVAPDSDVEGILKDYCKETANEIVGAFIGSGERNFKGLTAKLEQFFAGIKKVDANSLQSSERSIQSYVNERLVEALASKKRYLESSSSASAVSIMRYLILVQTDLAWKAHLRSMNYVKDFIALKAYGEDDPLNEYQRQGFEMFTNMMSSVRRNTVYSFFQHQVKKKEAAVAR